MIHGGDIYTYREKYHTSPLDFSANINPFGPSEEVLSAYRQASEEIHVYPDSEMRRLRQKIADAENLDPEMCVCGNGADDLIDRLMRAYQPKNVLIPMPAFTEYERLAKLSGAAVFAYPLPKEEAFALNRGFLSVISEETDLVILCEPNNPTGRQTDPALLYQILHRCEQTDTLLLVDECFLWFCENWKSQSMRRYLKDSTHLIILDAFTKISAIPGLRIGYALSKNKNLVYAMSQAGAQWNVSVPAEAAARAALPQRSVYAEQITNLRKPFYEALCALGLYVIPGEANFLLFQSEPGLLKALESRGILIRGCADFTGLDESWYRVCVRKAAENRQLLAALSDIRKTHQGNRSDME